MFCLEHRTFDWNKKIDKKIKPMEITKKLSNWLPLEREQSFGKKSISTIPEEKKCSFFPLFKVSLNPHSSRESSFTSYLEKLGFFLERVASEHHGEELRNFQGLGIGQLKVLKDLKKEQLGEIWSVFSVLALHM